MDETLKRRLIGAAVVVSLAVIFVPMLVEETPPPDSRIEGSNVPPREDLTFKSSLLKDEVVPSDAVPPNGEAQEAAPPVAVAPAPDVKPAIATAPDGSASEASSEAMPPREAARATEPPAPAAKPPVAQTPAAAAVAKATPGAPSRPVPKLTAWVIQVGNYSTEEKASAVVQALQAKGLEGFPERIDEGGKTTYRVSVGPEADRKRAEALLPRVEAAMGGRDKPFIRTFP